MRKVLLVVPAVLWLVASGLSAEDARWRPTGKNVLVVYVSNGEDRDGTGLPDSLEAARYYARRRGVPEENLLGLQLHRKSGRKGAWGYDEFFEQILTPVAAKLSSVSGDGEPLSKRICYILLAPGTRYLMDTHHAGTKEEKSRFRKTHYRSQDQYLISVAANLKAGLNRKTGAPGPGREGPLGAWLGELTLPIHGAFSSAGRARHFRRLRQEQPERFDFYLVCRLGLDLPAARDMLDGALYAEHHLRLPGRNEKAAFRPTIWLDQKYKFAPDHVVAMSRAVAIVQGLPGSPFALGRGLQSRWPLVIDTQLPEIGLVTGGSQHRPTVSARVADDGVDAKGLTLIGGRRIAHLKDIPSALYFPPRAKVTNGRAAATVVGIDVGNNRLLLDSTEGFSAGDTITYTWPGTFPADDCFIFYGFYGLGRYEDVFRFPPGALGVHVDSSCMTWARGAMRRGIAATFGVTTEPLSAGIPYGNLMLLALVNGYDWAEAVYGSLRIAQRWTGVVFGDPLYAPFRSRQVPDKSPPVIGPVSVKRVRDGVTITAALAGSSAEELADVALFKLEYGPEAPGADKPGPAAHPTRRYGRTIDFFDWPEPEKSGGVKGRRFGYSRHFRATLKGLKRGRTYHYRLTARDPAGLVTRTEDATFKP